MTYQSTAPKRQGGFTLIELAVAGIVLAVLVGGLAVWTYGRHRETANTTLMQQFFLKEAPAGINSYLLRNGTVVGLTKTDIVNNGARIDTPWGDVWTAAVAGNQVIITYPLDSARDPDDLGSDTAAYLAGTFGHIPAASYDNGAKDLSVTIQVQ